VKKDKWFISYGFTEITSSNNYLYGSVITEMHPAIWLHEINRYDPKEPLDYHIVYAVKMTDEEFKEWEDAKEN